MVSTSDRKPNIALHVTKGHEIFRKEIPYPSCGPEDCIVHVRCTGICGSEIHFWKHGNIGDYAVEEDLILGHESAGEVIEVGSNVKSLVIGDRVSIEPGIACLRCSQCRGGKYNLCPDVKFSGCPPTHGTLARYIVHPAHFLYKLPENMPYSHGALVEPLSVALRAVQRAGLRLGQPVVITGAGPIGLLILVCARAAGAYPICITDLARNRLEWAERLGAHCTVLVDREWDGKRIASEVLSGMDKVSSGMQPEIAFECSGASSSIYGASYSIRDGGVLMQVGHGKNEMTIPFESLSMREIDVRFLFRYIETWPVVIRLLSSGLFKGAEEIITHTYTVEETEKAFEIAADLKAGAVKVQITDCD